MGSHNNTMLAAVVDQGVSLVVRLSLELVDSDGLLCDLLDSSDVLNLVVGETDVFAETGVNKLFHLSPGGGRVHELNLVLFQGFLYARLERNGEVHEV